MFIFMFIFVFIFMFIFVFISMFYILCFIFLFSHFIFYIYIYFSILFLFFYIYIYILYFIMRYLNDALSFIEQYEEHIEHTLSSFNAIAERISLAFSGSKALLYCPSQFIVFRKLLIAISF